MSRIVDRHELPEAERWKYEDADWGLQIGRMRWNLIVGLVDHVKAGGDPDAAMFCEAELARREALS